MRIIHIIILSILLLAVPHQSEAQKKFTVVLDAGHGGKDPGAVGSSPRNREKDINLDIVLGIGRLLQSNCPDVKVLYTRQTDVFVELGKRADIANKAKADLFVSVHVNALPRNAKKAVGVQSYTLSLSTAGTNLEVEKAENSVIQYETDGARKYGFVKGTPEYDIIYELMQDRDMKESVNFAELAQREMVNTGGRKNMGVLQANLAVLRLTYMPSVLLEVGYISTPSEEQFLMTAQGRQTMAKSIYNAIAKYKTKITGIQSSLEKVSVTETPPPPVAVTTPQPATTTDPKTPKTEPAEPKTEPAEANNTKPEAAEPTASQPCFRVQILAGSRQLKASDPQFKGLKVDMFHEGNIYRYTYGACQTKEEAQKLRRSILDKFPGAFVVHY